MVRFLRNLLLLVLLLALAALGYGWTGYRDARNDTADLATRADALIASGRAGADLGLDRRDALIAVEDPAFFSHIGFDLTTPGAGITTISQSLAKRLGFAEFHPGLPKLRQTGYAIGMERGLSKPQILALFLDTVEMGRGPDGDWITGLWPASTAHFGATPDAISEADFLKLVAVMIAPGTLSLTEADAQLADRTDRIARLLAGGCVPDGNSDVWLTGCATE